MSEEYSSYFSGERLYGNDFSMDEIERWFQDESEGYAALGSKDRSSYSYGYHALNIRHGYRFLSSPALPRKASVLAFGAAYGDELAPIKESIDQVCILDPSDHFFTKEPIVKNVSWRKPNVSGEIDFAEDSFDLVTCLGVLHHIPNVQFVLKEIHRVLKPGGRLILREPTSSMGDWRKPRSGLTKRERGIPNTLLVGFAREAGFEVVSKHDCMFAPLMRIARLIGSKRSIYNSAFLTWLDSMICSVLSFRNYKYHRHSMLHKIAPSNLFLVLQK